MKVIFLIFIFCAQLRDTRQQVGLKIGNFHHLHRHHLNVLPRETLELGREIECVLSCIKKQDCFSFNSKKTTDETFLCEFLNTTKYRNHNNLTQDDNYVHWYFQQPCLVNPCNAGKCIRSDNDPAGYICDCLPGTFGQQCEHYESTYNFALRKPTVQSSTHISSVGSYTSSLAVDGDTLNIATYLGKPRCSLTKRDGTEWWRVDLQHEIPVSRVVITNRQDSFWSRLSDFEIKIGNSLVDDGMVNPKCGDRHAIGRGLTETISCSPPLHGRYLLVDSLIDNNVQICELEVYADP